MPPLWHLLLLMMIFPPDAFRAYRVRKEAVAGPPVVLPGSAPLLTYLYSLQRPVLDQPDNRFVRLEAEEYFQVVHRQEPSHLERKTMHGVGMLGQLGKRVLRRGAGCRINQGTFTRREAGNNRSGGMGI